MRVTVRLKISGEKKYMGKGVKELLDAIDQHHSIKKASEETGISYPKAIRMLKAFEEELGFPAIVSRKGGNSYGGSKLTENGREVLECFRALEKEIETFAIQLVEERFKFSAIDSVKKEDI